MRAAGLALGLAWLALRPAAAATLPDPQVPADRLLIQGSVAEMQGDLGLAAAAYRRVLELPEAPRVAGRALFRLGLLQESEDLLDEAGAWLARHDPAAAETGAWLEGLYARGRREELDRRLAQLPDTLLEPLRVQRLLENEGPAADEELERRLGGLLRLDEGAWERRGVRPALFWEQALAYGLRRGRAEQVAAWIDSSRLAQGQAAAWLARCRLAAFREDLPALRTAMARGRALDSLEAFYPLMAGRLALADGEPAQALGHLREARRLDSQDTGILSLLAVALEETGRLDEAERALRVLLATEPGEEDHWLQMAALLERQERRGEALALYQRALDQLDGEAGPLLKNNFAYALAMAGQRLPEALALAREAAAAAPDNAAYRDTLGWLLYLGGDFAGADEELQRAHDLCRGRPDPDILVHLGTLRQRQGRAAEAAALWDKALELKPDDHELEARLRALKESGAAEGEPPPAAAPEQERRAP